MVYNVNLSKVRQAFALWTHMFPTVRPFYAVKCCPDPRVVQTLFDCGAAFDCASPAEVNLVMDGVQAQANDIIYANPCKRPDDIVSVAGRGVLRTTFDSVCEIQKITRAGASNMELVLRIKADDPKARCPMGNKFGANESDWDVLADTARAHGFKVVGVSFHVGSFANSADAHALAIAKARRAFTLLEKYGFTPTLLDIGGGFSSENLDTILPVSVEINKAITEHGFDTCQVIAEPGRFLVEHAIELHTKVIGIKPGSVTIDESLYGAFNCIVMDHAVPEPVTRSDGPYTTMEVFGCTCDGADVIGKASLPINIDVGHVIRWPRMGAYTLAATTNFNGLSFDTRERKYLA